MNTDPSRTYMAAAQALIISGEDGRTLIFVDDQRRKHTVRIQHVSTEQLGPL